MTRLAWTIALATQLAMVVWLAVFFIGYGRSVPSAGPEQAIPIGVGVAGFTGLVVVGVLLARRQPGHPMARLLVVPFVLATAAFAFSAWALVAHHNAWWPLLGPAIWVTGWLWSAGPTGLILLVFRFPTGRSAGSWWRRYEYFVVATIAISASLSAFSPSTRATPLDLPNPLSIPALVYLDPVNETLTSLLVVHAAVGLACLVLRYTHGDAVTRQQLRWIATAGAMLIMGVIADAFLTSWLPEALGIAALPAAIGVALLRYRLWDLGLVIRRAVVYALLTGLLLLTYVGGVLALRSLLPDLLPEILLTGLTAIVALPLRALLQATLDHVLYGARRDPYSVIRALGHRLQAEATPLLPMVVTALAESLRLPYVAIELADGSIAASTGSPHDDKAVEAQLLHHRTELVGKLVAGRRHPAEPLTPHDRSFLEGISGHLGTAVHSAAVDEELRRSHERLLATRDEERLRIQRDLHDQLGPLLGAASLRTRAARNLLGTPGRLDDVLAAIGDDLNRALAEIRRILADLAPGPCDGQGLLAALRWHASLWTGNPSLRLDLPPSLPPLDAHIEAAAYRIAVEALHNARRHSRGSQVTMRVRLSQDSLHLDVIDDGVGFPAHIQPGVGLNSMRARAEQIGGSLELRTSQGGGVRVRSVLPVVTS
ncbi:sensor histidine kinase [Nonomuraea jabiensis]|uniref:histidine kinase n=1 Tax=Nonomuraea jabiensis TaxID=882448 RepID=A0A7W9L7S3_9ACTN|nr:ATP-binding protein [Nonomuraea jabiensis]MBB5773714.1 signal transduction histidine kinase [Nonomuraea jabiensis]